MRYKAFYGSTQDSNKVKDILDACAKQASDENRIIRQLNVSNQGNWILVSAFLEARK